MIRDLESEALRLLDWLYDYGGTDSPIFIDPFLSLRDLARVDERPLREYLDNRGLARTTLRLDGAVDAHLTAEGLRYVQLVRAERDNPAKRTADLRRQMLAWLYELESRGSLASDWTPFFKAGFSHLAGRPFDIGAIDWQASYLYKRRLISALITD